MGQIFARDPFALYLIHYPGHKINVLDLAFVADFYVDYSHFCSVGFVALLLQTFFSKIDLTAHTNITTSEYVTLSALSTIRIYSAINTLSCRVNDLIELLSEIYFLI